ncbi:hypothetical protein RESH_01381 [Rhodopirellula europaea SH398]|uniref:Uncharacterized protein n=1 Tax=Rhodopirellula europaea SH398 TaxID=1263868 RepID=M5S9B1_9BACT|nr:hypothetical protein RESH_01381 [Rhodopirellula europaea SH398]
MSFGVAIGGVLPWLVVAAESRESMATDRDMGCPSEEGGTSHASKITCPSVKRGKS